MVPGLHLGLPFLVMSHPLGNGKNTGTKRNYISHAQTATQRSGSTSSRKKHFPGQEWALG